LKKELEQAKISCKGLFEVNNDKCYEVRIKSDMLDRNIKEQNTNLSCKIAENSNKILSQA
jgi:hypothetical protein